MERNINSGEEYAKVLIEEIKSTDEPNQIIKDIWPYWFELINEAAVTNWEQYIIGKRETYMFSDKELERMWEKAGMTFVEDQVNGLVDKGMLEASVDEEGNILYGLTEEGKKYKL